MDKKQIIEDYLQGRHPMEQHSWELPSAQELERDEAEFDRLMEARNKPRRRLRLWPLAAAACVAGIIAIFLAPPRTTEQPPLALEEPTDNGQRTTVESQEPKAKAANEREKNQTGLSSSKREQARTKFKSQLATQHSPKGGDGGGLSTAKSQQPIEEPMLAEAEINSSHLGEVGRGALPEMEDPFLAIAQQMQDIRSRGEQVRQEVAQLIDSKVNLQ